jgi:hypothetical protein
MRFIGSNNSQLMINPLVLSVDRDEDPRLSPFGQAYNAATDDKRPVGMGRGWRKVADCLHESRSARRL